MNPQQVLPSAEVTFESQALGDLVVEMTVRSIALFPLLDRSELRRYCFCDR